MLAQGVYDLRGTEFEVGKIAFSYGPPSSGTQILMRRPPGAVQATLGMPRHSKIFGHDTSAQIDHADALDGDTEMVVRIKSNSCQMKNARLQVVSMEDAMQYHLAGARVNERRKYTLTYSSQSQLTLSCSIPGYRPHSGRPRSWIGPRSSHSVYGHSTWGQCLCESPTSR